MLVEVLDEEVVLEKEPELELELTIPEELDPPQKPLELEELLISGARVAPEELAALDEPDQSS